LNALQECLQPEGTPQFAGGLKAIQRIAKKIKIPIIIKETGCGFSLKTLKTLKNTGIYAVDISGLGGTHWGRIEGDRARSNSNQEKAAKTFQNWGIGTIQSMANGIKMNGKASKGSYNLWASGGVRTGLDAAKLLAMGAEAVGFAKPAMEQALSGKNSLFEWMGKIEYELKVAMFCTGSGNIKQLKKAEWTYKKT
jgi:isopentenyl-diphosphate delta-isomerase